MSAQIRISVERGGMIISTNVNQSVDNVRKGDIVYCESVDVHSTYSWTLVFTPDSPNGTVSTSGLINPPGSTTNTCKFIVDNEGAYLIRLVVDGGLATESTQFLRVRKVTRFGDLKLVAAGERKDSVGAIPADIDPVGWADNQNQNLQKLLAYVRRLSTSGRVLYVDANRGRKAFDDTQNANDPTNTLEMPGSDLTALTTSGVVTDAEGFADFSDISSAITYAQACASRGESPLSADNPYVILVQNGLYIEDVNLVPNIHLVSADNFYTHSEIYAKGVVIRSTNATGGHTFVGSADSDSVICVGVEFENTDPSSTNPTMKVQRGKAYFIGCTISHKSGTGGSALSAIPVNPTSADECQVFLINSFVQNTVANATEYAIKIGSDCGYLALKNSTVVGENGIQCNANFGGGLKEKVDLHIGHSTVMANNVNGYAVLTNASDTSIEHSYIVGSDSTKVLAIGENLPKVGDVVVKLAYSEFNFAQISFDTRQITGQSKLFTSSCIFQGYVFPSVPPIHNAETQAKSLKYESNYADPFNGGALAVPVPNQLGATDVQDAIDDLAFLSAILGAFGTFNSLDVAYDGVVSVNPPTLGSGDGRRISADQGAVVIQSATAPYVTTPVSGTETTPLTSGDKNGYLQVEGNIELGKIDSAEMSLISNYGTIGSMLSMGSVTWNSEIASVASGADHRSLPSAIIQGNSDKDGLLHNYNLRLQTKSTSSISNGSVGWVILQGGDSLEKGTNAPHAGDVYIQGGSYLESANESVGDNCPSGSIHLIPGTSTALGSDEPYGYVKLINPTASTNASLTASALCSNPTTCGGEISWATPMGVVTATITIGMTVADVVNAINNATVGKGLIFAQEITGTITLTCASKGELGDVVYVGDTDSGNLNADLGDFQIASGAIFVKGTDPQYVNIHSSAMHEITIGEGGAFGAMIYNSDTGKLTVPGLIDPIGMIFEQTAHTNVPTGATEGALFISDGTDGLVQGRMYFKPANNGTPVDLTTGGGGGGSLTFWTEDGSGNLLPNATGTQSVGSVSKRLQNVYVNATSGLTLTDGSSNFVLNVPSPSTPTLDFNGNTLAYQSAVSANTASISSNTTNIAINTTNISANTANINTKIGYSDLSITTNSASGNGSLSYNSANGIFTFTPADVSGVGGLSGSGSQYQVPSFDGTGSLIGTANLQHAVNAQTAVQANLLYLSSQTTGGNETGLVFSDVNEIHSNWFVGRGRLGGFRIATQSTWSDQQTPNFDESTFDYGWIFQGTDGGLDPLSDETQSIGHSGARVSSIFVAGNTNNQGITFVKDDGSGGTFGATLSYSTSTAGNSVLKLGSETIAFLSDLSGAGISLTDLSVSTSAPSGNGSLSYNNTTGVFTFTPASVSTSLNDLGIVDGTNGQVLTTDGAGNYTFQDASGGIALADLSVTSATPSGNGSLSYNNATGVFTYTPADVPTVLTDLGISDGTSGQVLTTNGAGSFSFTTVSGGGTASSITDGTSTLDFDVSNNLQADTHFLPTADVTYDLGSPTQRWRDLYLSGASIDLGGNLISTDGTNLSFKGGSVPKGLSSSDIPDPSSYISNLANNGSDSTFTGVVTEQIKPIDLIDKSTGNSLGRLKKANNTMPPTISVEITNNGGARGYALVVFEYESDGVTVNYQRPVFSKTGLYSTEKEIVTLSYTNDLGSSTITAPPQSYATKLYFYLADTDDRGNLLGTIDQNGMSDKFSAMDYAYSSRRDRENDIVSSHFVGDLTSNSVLLEGTTPGLVFNVHNNSTVSIQPGSSPSSPRFELGVEVATSGSMADGSVLMGSNGYTVLSFPTETYSDSNLSTTVVGDLLLGTTPTSVIDMDQRIVKVGGSIFAMGSTANTLITNSIQYDTKQPVLGIDSTRVGINMGASTDTPPTRGLQTAKWSNQATLHIRNNPDDATRTDVSLRLEKIGNDFASDVDLNKPSVIFSENHSTSGSYLDSAQILSKATSVLGETPSASNFNYSEIVFKARGTVNGNTYLREVASFDIRSASFYGGVRVGQYFGGEPTADDWGLITRTSGNDGIQVYTADGWKGIALFGGGGRAFISGTEIGFPTSVKVTGSLPTTSGEYVHWATDMTAETDYCVGVWENTTGATVTVTQTQVELHFPNAQHPSQIDIVYEVNGSNFNASSVGISTNGYHTKALNSSLMVGPGVRLLVKVRFNNATYMPVYILGMRVIYTN